MVRVSPLVFFSVRNSQLNVRCEGWTSVFLCTHSYGTARQCLSKMSPSHLHCSWFSLFACEKPFDCGQKQVSSIFFFALSFVLQNQQCRFIFFQRTDNIGSRRSARPLVAHSFRSRRKSGTSLTIPRMLERRSHSTCGEVFCEVLGERRVTEVRRRRESRFWGTSMAHRYCIILASSCTVRGEETKVEISL